MKIKILYTDEEFEKTFGKDYLNEEIPDHEYYGNENPYPTEAECEFEKEIRAVLQGLIDDAFSSLTEEKEGSRKSNFEIHFDAHCLGNHEDRKSRPSNIFYDFKTVGEYKQYADSIVKSAEDTPMRISSLFDEELFYKYIRKLFEGNQTIYFTNSCGFHNSKGDTVLALHAWANKATKNYLNNTIDILVMTSKKVFITIYPVDAQELENKFHSVIAKYNDANAHGVS